jgi:hypothetical protein
MRTVVVQGGWQMWALLIIGGALLLMLGLVAGLVLLGLLAVAGLLLLGQRALQALGLVRPPARVTSPSSSPDGVIDGEFRVVGQPAMSGGRPAPDEEPRRAD